MFGLQSSVFLYLIPSILIGVVMIYNRVESILSIVMDERDDRLERYRRLDKALDVDEMERDLRVDEMAFRMERNKE